MKHTYKNITFNLVKLEKSLVFQILEQDESWMASYGSNKILIFRAKNGYAISSCLEHRPSLSDCGVVHLQRWGYGFESYRASILDWFNENKTRDLYYNKILEALKEWDEYVNELKQKNG